MYRYYLKYLHICSVININKKIKIKKYLFGGLILTCFFACSGEKDGSNESIKNEIIKEETIEDKKWQSFVVGAVRNTMSEMKYDIESISVKEGSWVRITLENRGVDNSMMHNIVFVKYGAREKVASEAIKIWPSQNFIINKDNVISYSDVSKAGQSVVLEFKAPKKGNYEFLCTYPGHAEIMRGYFFVK